MPKNSATPQTPAVRRLARWTAPAATLLIMAAAAPAAHAGPLSDLNSTVGNVNSTIGNVAKA
ncbi:hypothetical protein ACWD11_27480 [Streptomyces sp. NPDC002776]